MYFQEEQPVSSDAEGLSRSTSEPEIQEQRSLTDGEALAFFSFDPERAREIVKATEGNIDRFLERRGVTQDVCATIMSLWQNTILCFSGDSDKNKPRHMFEREGKPIGQALWPNALPAHDLYHTAKVVTLACLLGEKLLSNDHKDSQDAEVLVAAAILHDVGQLRQNQEEEPQERYYDKHEQRSIEVARQILPEFGFDESFVGKVSDLIGATDPRTNMQQAPEDVSARILAASDHGAYLLEPNRQVEVMGLWQELQRAWEKDGKLMTRPVPAESSAVFLMSDFPRKQRDLYGTILNRLDNNPFWNGKSITDTFEFIEKTTKLISGKSLSDGLMRFEGSFSTRQLMELGEKLGVDDELFRKKLIDFSKKLSERPAEPSDFSALSTDVLRYLFQISRSEKHATPDAFFTQAFEILSRQSSQELVEGGTVNLHIAPFAYTQDGTVSVDEVLDCIDKAIGSFPALGRVYLTIRQDKEDSLEALISSISKMDSSNRYGIAVAGLPTRGVNWIRESLDKIQNTAIPIVVQVGLEDSEQHPELLKEKLNAVMAAVERGKDGSEFVRLHIGGHYVEVLMYYSSLPDEQKSIFLNLVGSVSPLSHVLVSDQRQARAAYEELKEFLKVFKNVQPSSHNASQLGDMGLAVENALMMGMTRSSSPE